MRVLVVRQRHEAQLEEVEERGVGVPLRLRDGSRSAGPRNPTLSSTLSWVPRKPLELSDYLNSNLLTSVTRPHPPSVRLLHHTRSHSTRPSHQTADHSTLHAGRRVPGRRAGASPRCGPSPRAGSPASGVIDNKHSIRDRSMTTFGVNAHTYALRRRRRRRFNIGGVEHDFPAG